MKVQGSQKAMQEEKDDKSEDTTATRQGWCDQAAEILIKMHSEQLDGAGNRGDMAPNAPQSNGLLALG
jgi:hypothetical protein